MTGGGRGVQRTGGVGGEATQPVEEREGRRERGGEKERKINKNSGSYV